MFTCFVVGLLLFSSFTAIGIGEEASVTNKNIKKVTSIGRVFFEPQVISKENFIEINMKGTNGYLYKAGQPILPLFKTTIDLPFGTKIVGIDCITSTIKTKTLSKKITPAPNPMITDMNNHKIVQKMDDTVYSSSEFYPGKWYDYFIGSGLDENSEYKTFLTIRIYPTRYSPRTDTIQYVNNINLKIAYKEPETSFFPETSTYDMVIIAPSAFTSELQRLVAHKNKYEIKTTIKTLEEIYLEYTGFDEPEQIKYFIKDAIETWGIKYVMLVGGMKSPVSGQSRDNQNKGVKDWWFPARYTNLKETGGLYDPGFLSDLYYADIYDSEGKFSSWDKDKKGESDGIYAAWKMGFPYVPKDYIDFYPDVYVGRLACRNINEVKTVVTKIIDYERLKHESNWYERMVVAGGDSHDDSGTNYLEGEVECDYILNNYMTEWTPIKLYASNKDIDMSHVPSTKNIQREITAGCGFLLFDGHGHPGSWNTHWPGIFTWDDTPGGIQVSSFYGLKNEKKLPICVIGGCHNSQFNVTLMATTLNEPFMWTHGMPVSECFAWQLVKLSQGGTIASFGNTGLGYGAVGENGDIDGDGENLPDTLEALGGYQIRMFFKTIDEGEEILGAVWGKSIKKYLDTFPGMDYQVDAKTVEEWPLLGDPSLKLGGYQTDSGSRSINYEKFPLIIKILELPIFQKMLKLL